MRRLKLDPRSVGATIVVALGFIVYAQPLWPRHFTEFELVLLLLVASLALGTSPAMLRETAKRAWPLWALLALMFASALWSDDSWAALTGSALVAALFATALVQAAGPGITPILRGLAIGTVAVLTLSLIVAIVDPVAGVNDLSYQRGALRGVFSHRNTLGYTLAIGAPAIIALTPRSFGGRVARIVAIAAVVAGVLATQSATALVAVGITAVIVIVQFIVRRTTGRRARLVTAGIGLGVLVAAAAAWTAVSELLGRSSDLTGRTHIWDAAWQVASERPLLGFGWNSVWNYAQDPGLRIQRKLGYHFSHPHDAWLEVMLTLGIVGIAVVVWLLATTAWRAAQVGGGPTRTAYWFALVLAVTIVYTVPETMLTRPLGLWMLALVLLLAVRERVEQQAAEAKTDTPSSEGAAAPVEATPAR